MTDDWVALSIAKAKAEHPLVPPPVVESLEGLLRGPLTERELPKGELTTLAKTLIAGLGPTPPEPTSHP